MKLSAKSLLHRNSKQVFNDIDGEIVMLSIENSAYFYLNLIGSDIWRLLEQPIQYEELINQLLVMYETTYLQCERETNIFLEELSKFGLINISNV